MSDVTLKNVVKNFGKVKVVKNVDMEIKSGEFIVLVGPSGCGKTTTLRMIAGLEEVTSGTILIDGKDVTLVPPKDRDIAMVFQNYALYPHMSVKQNMGFALKIRKTPKHVIEERVAEASEILGLQDLLERKPKELSGGQRQRVALGRAIVRQPKVFLMDEPLSNLDAKLRVQMRGELKKLHNRLKATVIYVTHDQVEAMTLGTRICVMNDGIIQQYDNPMEVYNSPNNTFVASFMGSPSMNFFEGEIQKVKGKTDKFVFDIEGVKIDLPEQLNIEFKKYMNRELFLGVRPESIVDFSKAVRKKYTDQKVVGKVEFAELLGSQTYVHVRIGHTPFLAEIDPSYEFNINDEIELGFHLKYMHLFDKKTKETLI